VALLRGKEGTIANLIIERDGKQIAISAKRTEIAVLNAKGATVWQKNLGKLPAGANNVDLR